MYKSGGSNPSLVSKLNKHKMKARIGNLIKVSNEDKKPNENKYYYPVILKDLSAGGKIENFIFTQAEINSAFARAMRNQEDCLERSLISRIID